MDNILSEEKGLSDVELIVEETLKNERISQTMVKETAFKLDPGDRVQYLNALLSFDGMKLKYADQFEENVPKMVNLLLDFVVPELRVLRKNREVDKTTGLKSRDYIEKTDREAKEQYSVLMMDLDKFKSWNDKYGHNVGDIVLKVLGHIIRDSIRKTEGFIGSYDKSYAARYGGEEFYVELNQTNAENAMKVAERIRYNVKKNSIALIKKELEEKDLEEVYEKIVDNKQAMTISIGVDEELQGKKPEEVRRRADIALYHAKYKGRDRVMKYESSMNMPEEISDKI